MHSDRISHDGRRITFSNHVLWTIIWEVDNVAMTTSDMIKQEADESIHHEQISLAYLHLRRMSSYRLQSIF